MVKNIQTCLMLMHGKEIQGTMHYHTLRERNVHFTFSHLQYSALKRSWEERHLGKVRQQGMESSGAEKVKSDVPTKRVVRKQENIF